MTDADRKHQELLLRHAELQSVCEIWIAANDAKDARITELEAEVSRLQERSGRLARLAGRRAGSQVTGRLLKIS